MMKMQAHYVEINPCSYKYSPISALIHFKKSEKQLQTEFDSHAKNGTLPPTLSVTFLRFPRHLICIISWGETAGNLSGT